jgi:acetoacetyl-CoA synthetase
MTAAPLWTPSAERVAATQVVTFMQRAAAQHGVALSSYRDLHAWSLKEPAAFWSLVWDFCGVVGE